MRNIFAKLAFVTAALLYASIGRAQTQVNPSTQIRWPAVSGSGAPVTGCPVTTAATTTSGSTQVTVTSQTGIFPGQAITGTGVPAATTVESAFGGTVTMSAAATASGTPTLSFWPYGMPYTDTVGNTHYDCGSTGWFQSGGSGAGTVTSFTAASASWPTWLVPTVTSASTTPSLSVAAAYTPARSGANTDITSLAGLTTPLSVPQGGTGAATGTGYAYGNGTSPFTFSTAIPYSALTGAPTIPTVSGTSNSVAKFTGASAVGNSSVTDDGATPTRAPNGLNTALAGNYQEFTAATGGVTQGQALCVTGTNDVGGRPEVAPCSTSSTGSGFAGVARTSASAGATVQVCWTVNCPAIFDNQTTQLHEAIVSTTTAGELHDTGLTTATAGQSNFSILSANTGAGTTALIGISDATANNPAGGGGGGKSGLSGMTAGQVPIAATATTITSSKALAGTGTGIATGPTTTTLNDCAKFGDTAGTLADAGAPCGSGSGGNATFITADATGTPPTNYQVLTAGTGVTVTPNAGTHTVTIGASSQPVQLTRAGTLFPPTSAQQWADQEPRVIYDTSPQILTSYSNVFKLIYHCAYSTMSLCYAESPDGLPGTWTQFSGNPVLACGREDFFKSGTTYELFCVPDSNNNTINYYTSTNGTTWTLNTANIFPCCQTWQASTGASAGVAGNTGIVLNGATYDAYVEWFSTDGIWRTGLWTASTLAGPWTAYASNPIIPTNGMSSTGMCGGPFPALEGSTIYILEHCTGPNGTGTGIVPTDIYAFTAPTSAPQTVSLVSSNPVLQRSTDDEGVALPHSQVADATMAEVNYPISGGVRTFVMYDAVQDGNAAPTGLNDGFHIKVATTATTIANFFNSLPIDGAGTLAPRPVMMTNGALNSTQNYLGVQQGTGITITEGGGIDTITNANPFTAGGDLTGTGTSQTVHGLDGVPFCTGYAPGNGNLISYTTGGSPNPCYTSATNGAGFTLTTTGTSGASTFSGGVLNIPVYSGGGGNYVNLCSLVTLTNASCSSGQIIPNASVSSITISAIPGTYLNLHLSGTGRTSDATNAVGIFAQFNADTGANYDIGQVNGGYSTVTNSGTTGTVGQTSLQLGNFAASTAATSMPGAFQLTIQNYAGTTFYKSFLGRSWWPTDTSVGHMTQQSNSGEWRGTAAITSILISDASAGTFATGTVFTLYGTN